MEQTLCPPRPEAPDLLGAALLDPSADSKVEQTIPPRGAVTTPRGVSSFPAGRGPGLAWPLNGSAEPRPTILDRAPETTEHWAAVPSPDNTEQTISPARDLSSPSSRDCGREGRGEGGREEKHSALSAFPLSPLSAFSLPPIIPAHLLSPDPAAAARSTAEAHAKLRLLERAAEIRHAAQIAGESMDDCRIASALGLTKSTFCKLQKTFAAHGPLGLLDRKHLTGRKPKFTLTENEALVLRGCVLARSSEGQLRFLMAMEDFLTQPACLPLTREFMRAELDAAAREQRDPVWPPYLRRLGYPTREERAAFRGKKHSQAFEIVDRRAMIWRDEFGNQFAVGPHCIREMDDWSANTPRSSLDPETGRPMLNRQVLTSLDLFSNAWLHSTPVSRPRDSYRTEDVAAEVEHCAEAWGWPEFYRLEKGEIWDGTFFHGIKVTAPGWGDKKWGGISTYARVVNTWKSRGKGNTEGSFNTAQALGAHAALDIGRTRGEFEKATTALVRAHGTGQIDERFFTDEEFDHYLEALGNRLNLRPQSRRAFGRGKIVPADLLRHAKGRPVLAHERWVFSPVKREATVRGGHVEISINHYPQTFRFRVNGVDDQLHLDHGHRVLVAFHPGFPERGCFVMNAELTLNNRYNFRAGEFIILAAHAQDVPQVDLSHPDFGYRKKANAAARRSYIAIGAAVAGQHGHHAQDAHGQPTTTLVDPQLPQIAEKAESGKSEIVKPRAPRRDPWADRF